MCQLLTQRNSLWYFKDLLLAFWLFRTPQLCIKESSGTSLWIRFIAPLLSKRIERNNLSGFCPEHKNISTWFHSHQGFRDLLSPFHYKDRLSRYGICIMKIRRLWESLFFVMGNLILIRRFSIELALTNSTNNRQLGCMYRCGSWHIISSPLVFTKLRLPLHDYVTGTFAHEEMCNRPLRQQQLFRWCIRNVLALWGQYHAMLADALAPNIARASTGMVSSMYDWQYLSLFHRWVNLIYLGQAKYKI